MPQFNIPMNHSRLDKPLNMSFIEPPAMDLFYQDFPNSSADKQKGAFNSVILANNAIIKYKNLCGKGPKC